MPENHRPPLPKMNKYVRKNYPELSEQLSIQLKLKKLEEKTCYPWELNCNWPPTLKGLVNSRRTRSYRYICPLHLGSSRFLAYMTTLLYNKRMDNLATITCPHCHFSKSETMAVDSCQFFYTCTHCGEVLKPLKTDCCVFCSYSDTKCPPKLALG